MYSRNPDKRPSRPVISSLTGALSEIDHWMDENRFRDIKDGDGLMWALELKVKQVADPSETHGLLWQTTVHLDASVDAETFIQTGTLQREVDSRLVALIGEAKIPISLKPSTYTARSEDEMRQMIASVVPKLKTHLQKNSFYDVKRRLIGRWIDEAQIIR